jgi:acetyl-CoA decarbonylase/synthase complex subunit gamma
LPLRGSDIVKKLPNRKGCKECGFPTCFAFAMKLATGGTTIDKCPYLPAEVKKEIEEAMAPPIKLVTIGSGQGALHIGNEEALFRHDNAFVHQPGIALLITDKEPDAKVDEKIKKFKDLQFPWVGLTLKADLLALQFESGDKAKYQSLVKKMCDSTDTPVMLMADDVDVLLAARGICGNRQPLLYPVTKENIDEVIAGIESVPTPVGVKANSMEELIPLTTKLKEAGLDEIVLEPVSKTMQEAIRNQTLIRRAALKQNSRPLGYPTIGFPCFMAEDSIRQVILAAMFVIKYAGIIVLSELNQYSLLPLLVHRLSIYTNPQTPLSTEEKIYEIGNPNEKSPVLIASNWALTYLILSSAIEETNIPAFLCVKRIEEADVLCWCPHCLRSTQLGNLNIDDTRRFIDNCGIEGRVKHRKLVIPGRASRFRVELEKSLTNWEIIVGPEEASQIKRFLPEFTNKLNGLT